MTVSSKIGCKLSATDDSAARAEPESTHRRRPYQKPAFQFERVFETMALSCGKVVTTQFQCHFHSKTS